MKISIFKNRKTVVLNDELVEDYNSVRPSINTKTAEFLLAGNGIDENTTLSNEELSLELASAMREEINVVIDMTVGMKAQEALKKAKR